MDNPASEDILISYFEQKEKALKAWKKDASNMCSWFHNKNKCRRRKIVSLSSPAFLHRYVLTDAGLIHTWKYNMVGWLLAFYMYPFSNICTISEWGLPPHVDAWHQHVLESCLWFMFIFCSYARHFSFMVPGTKVWTERLAQQPLDVFEYKCFWP